MHLSSKELKVAYAIYGGPATEREEWLAEAIRGRSALVHCNERSTKEKDRECVTCGREWPQPGGAAELHPEMGWYAQYRADRALWSAAEPVPIADASGEPW